jgi:hypothetical protein
MLLPGSVSGYLGILPQAGLITEEKRTNPRQARLLRSLVDSGVAPLGPARIEGRLCLRACMTHLRTSEADVDRVVAALATAML